MKIDGSADQIVKKDAEYRSRTVNVGINNGEAHASGLPRPFTHAQLRHWCAVRELATAVA